MDDRIERVAALSNAAFYGSEETEKYVDGAPHIKHRVLRRLYGELVVRVYDRARQRAAVPKVLDLGAGEGSVTLPFLELGAKVTAVDISRSQIAMLRKRCEGYRDRLETVCGDINEFLTSTGEKYDVVVTNSFLHHIPDYLGLIGNAVDVLAPSGQYFTFHDPLRYDTVGKPTRLFTGAGYLFWRSTKGNVMRGVKTRIRRVRGIYSEEHEVDFAEYHVVRGGVDQNAIVELLKRKHFDCSVIRYFSSQSRLFQLLGTRLGIENTFGVIARKKEEAVVPEFAIHR